LRQRGALEREAYGIEEEVIPAEGAGTLLRVLGFGVKAQERMQEEIAKETSSAWNGLRTSNG